MQVCIRIGLIPDAGGTYVLSRQMGLAKSMGTALFTDKTFAGEAFAMGMIREPVPDEKFAAIGHITPHIWPLAQRWLINI